MWTGGESKKFQIFCGYGSHLMSYSLPTLTEERQGASTRQKGGSKGEPPSLEEEEKGSVWEQACFEQCRSVPSRSQSNIYRMQLCTPGGMQPKLVVEAPCAFDDGQIRWGREARRALFGKKMPAAANIDSVAVNGADGLRSQWREGVNTKHHMRGLFLTKCQWPSNSESQETFTPLLYSHKPLTKK